MMSPTGSRKRSRVLVESFDTIVKRLDDLEPELANVVEQHRPRSARETATDGPQPKEGALGRPVGRVFQNADLHGDAFVVGLAATLSRLNLDLNDQETLLSLAVRDHRHFVSLVREALTTDRGHAVTPSKAVGNYFERVGWDHPLAFELRAIVMDVYTDTVHALVAGGDKLRNGLFEPVTLRSQFRGQVKTVENPRIIDATTGVELDGGQWVDRVDFRVNRHDQYLMIYGDLKVAGQAGELRHQVATRDPRLLAALSLQHNARAQPVIVGKVDRQIVHIRLDSMMFPVDLDANTLNRIGVRASVRAQTRYDAKIAKDEHSEPYVRMSVYCRTDLMYRFFVSLYREMGW